MEKVLNYFKNKKLGFYFGIANVIFAIVLAIIFFATYKGDYLCEKLRNIQKDGNSVWITDKTGATIIAPDFERIAEGENLSAGKTSDKDENTAPLKVGL